MGTPVQIDYYTDILCVWAWIAQRRLDEIVERWGAEISVSHRFVDVFGNTANKIGVKWADRGGYAGFAEHVEHSSAPYETAPVNPAIWREVRPASSAAAHVVLKAASDCGDAEAAERLAVEIRRAFFVDAADIGNEDVLLGIAADNGFDRATLRAEIESGRAIAAVMADYQRAAAAGIEGSPSWVLNEGRQVLYGNVGFRLVNANVEELIRKPPHEASWC